jgi:hypothetical protein
MQSLNNSQDIPLGPSREDDTRVTFNLLAEDLVSQVLALQRKQVQVEHEHLAHGNGHCTLSSTLCLLGLL